MGSILKYRFSITVVVLSDMDFNYQIRLKTRLVDYFTLIECVLFLADENIVDLSVSYTYLPRVIF